MGKWLIPFSWEEVREWDKIILIDNWFINKWWEIEDYNKDIYRVWMVDKQRRIIRTTEYYIMGYFVEISDNQERNTAGTKNINCYDTVRIDRRPWYIRPKNIIIIILILSILIYFNY